MRQRTIALSLGLLLFGGVGLAVVPSLLDGADDPVGAWDQSDETEIVADDADPEVVQTDLGANGSERTALADGEAGDESRVAVVLRGRVVNKFAAPVADAKVWLDFGRGGPRERGGRQRRVPDPVRTDAEGRFAFQGQTFRNLRVTLQVAHANFAPGAFDRDLGEVAAEVELGDLALSTGGEAFGRVTDLEGNGVPSATVRLEREGFDAMRWLRDRDGVQRQETVTDQAGNFRIAHVPPGEFRAVATAKQHTEGSSETNAVEDDVRVDFGDIRLGPGFEVTGIVTDVQNKPVAGAEVVLRGNGRAGRGERGERAERAERGRGRPQGGGPGGRFDSERRTETDANGHFTLEHLPGVTMTLQVDANGFLRFTRDDVEPKSGAAIYVTLQDGLKIRGVVTDASTGTLVTKYAVRATWVRALPVPESVTERQSAARAQLDELVQQLRSGTLDDAQRAQVQSRMAEARRSLEAVRAAGERRGPPSDWGRGGRNQGPGGRDGGQAGRPTDRPDGRFVESGLQEGIYQVLVTAPTHARHRTAEVELRAGAPAPDLAIALERGFTITGVVRDGDGKPVAEARVELRETRSDAGGGRNGERRRGGRNGGNEGAAAVEDAAQTMRAMFAPSVVEATTGRDGAFTLQHAPGGTFRVSATARGHTQAASEPFDLVADRTGVDVVVQALGAVAGNVLALRPEEVSETRVAVIPASLQNAFAGGRGRGDGGGPFPTANVGPDGAYRIADLAPGNYYVRAFVGTPMELMRELAPSLLGGTVPHDVTVKSGETVRHDLRVSRPQTGTVTGDVQHNGQPAAGFQIVLSRIGEDPPQPAQMPGTPGPWNRIANFNREHRATVNAGGTFTARSVPAGTYMLRVSNARRGANLHEEQVVVVAEHATTVSVFVSTGSLEGEVTFADGTPPEQVKGMAVVLYAGVTEVPNAEPGQSGVRPEMARVQNGKFTFEAVKPGPYLLVLRGGLRDRTTQLITVTGGVQRIAVTAGAKIAPPAANGGVQTSPSQPPRRGG